MGSGFGGDRSMNRELAELIRRAMQNRDARRAARAGAGTVSPAAGAKEPVSLTTAQKWLVQLRLIRQGLPAQWSDWRINQFAQFDIKRIYRNGEIQATCSFQGQVLEVFADGSGNQPSVGCSCPASLGEAPCSHAYAYLLYLIEQLSNSDSRLNWLLEQGSFTGGVPSRDRFKPDLELQAIERLDELLQRTPAALEEADELPPLPQDAGQRLAWNLQFGDRYLTVEPVIQQRKKRGEGYTKGRKISLDKLKQSDHLALSDADRRVVYLIKINPDAYGFRVQWMLDPFKAIEQLIGQPNVILDDQACRVERTEYQVTLLRHEDKWRFALMHPDGRQPGGRTAMGDGGIVTVLSDQARALFAPVPPGGQRTLQALLSLPPLGDKHAALLFDKARRLQTVLPIRLPEEVGGEIVPERTRPVVLLRSCADGSLDYGLRVRDSAGRLHRPGAPPALRADTDGDQPVQRLRNLSDEIDRVQTLASQLGIEVGAASGWDGTIRDFAAGLNLIESVQTHHSDVEVLWDRKSQQSMTVLGHLTAKNVKVDISSKRDWFGLSGSCDLGTQTLSLQQLLQALPSESDQAAIQGDFIRIADGQWARISSQLRQRLQRLRDATHVDRKTLLLDATAAPAVRDLLADEIELSANKNWHQCLARLERAEQLEPVLPAGLQAELRDYQLAGYQWLRRLAEWGVGGVLADDMGLGKTLQTLAVLLDRADDGPALVIAPTSVGFNWVREAQRFTPGLRAHLYRETEREDFLTGVRAGDLVVCSYGLALRDEKALGQVRWSTVVLDEAQAVKNSRSKTAQAIAKLQANWMLALTGTPVENHLGELWSLFHLVSPGVFGGWDHFRRRFALPIEKQHDASARASLANRLQPFVLRRSKSQVLTELPPRTEMNLYVDLSPEERNQYERVRMSAIGEIDQIAALPNLQDQRFKLLALLTRLRQFACHPGIVNRQWTGSSAKLDQLCSTLDELKEEGHRALIFSQFTQHLDLIRQALDKRGISYQYLDGATPAAMRQQRVDAFQNGDGDAFLISLKAGGTGLNLTAADYVIHMDPWWNPAVEDQATDRAHRIGQDKPVMVYRIIARGTIEDEILSLHETKRDLVTGVLEGTAAAASLSSSELINLLRAQPE